MQKSSLEFVHRHFVCPRRLVEAMFLLTHGCDLRCRHCNIERERRRELTTPTWLSAVRELAELGAMQLYISGGEATRHPGWVRILREADRRGLALTLFTNGLTLTERVVAKLRGLRWREVAISIYDLDPLRHEAVTGIPGSWRRSVAALARLQTAGIPVAINHVVMTMNRRGTKRLREWARARGYRFHSGTMLLTTIHGGGQPLQWRTGEENRVFARTPESAYPLWRRSCGCGEVSTTINAYGDVYPCSFFPVPVGNVRECGLMPLWRTSPVITLLQHGLDRASAKLPCSRCRLRPKCLHCYGQALLEEGSTALTPRAACKRFGNFAQGVV